MYCSKYGTPFGPYDYGPPDDDESEDAITIDVWAGEIPIITSFGQPVASPGVRTGIPIPASVHALLPDVAS